jgi:hypothetical protein
VHIEHRLCLAHAARFKNDTLEINIYVRAMEKNVENGTVLGDIICFKVAIYNFSRYIFDRS